MKPRSHEAGPAELATPKPLAVLDRMPEASWVPRLSGGRARCRVCEHLGRVCCDDGVIEPLEPNSGRPTMHNRPVCVDCCDAHRKGTRR